MPRRFLPALVFMLMLGLAACQSTTDPAVEMIRFAFQGIRNPTGEGLNPAFSYLRVTSGQRVAFFALGYVDPHPKGNIEVWYSAEHETLRLQNGRVVGISGTLAEWREVRLPVLPAWDELLSLDSAYRWTRSRDVMPGYQFNLRDELQLVSLPAPLRSSLYGLDAKVLHWFEERMLPSSVDGVTLPPARYALQKGNGGAVVVYGEQCITTDVCLTWQRWKPRT